MTFPFDRSCTISQRFQSQSKSSSGVCGNGSMVSYPDSSFRARQSLSPQNFLIWDTSCHHFFCTPKGNEVSTDLPGVAVAEVKLSQLAVVGDLSGAVRVAGSVVLAQSLQITTSTISLEHELEMSMKTREQRPSQADHRFWCKWRDCVLPRCAKLRVWDFDESMWTATKPSWSSHFWCKWRECVLLRCAKLRVWDVNENVWREIKQSWSSCFFLYANDKNVLSRDTSLTMYTSGPGSPFVPCKTKKE